MVARAEVYRSIRVINTRSASKARRTGSVAISCIRLRVAVASTPPSNTSLNCDVGTLPRILSISNIDADSDIPTNTNKQPERTNAEPTLVQQPTTMNKNIWLMLMLNHFSQRLEPMDPRAVNIGMEKGADFILGEGSEAAASAAASAAAGVDRQNALAAAELARDAERAADSQADADRQRKLAALRREERNAQLAAADAQAGRSAVDAAPPAYVEPKRDDETWSQFYSRTGGSSTSSTSSFAGNVPGRIVPLPENAPTPPSYDAVEAGTNGGDGNGGDGNGGDGKRDDESWSEFFARQGRQNPIITGGSEPAL